MIASVFTLGINDIIVKGLSYKFPIWEIVFFRAISGAIISIGLVLIFGINSIKTKKPIGHLFRAFSAVACVVLFFFGIKLLLWKRKAFFNPSFHPPGAFFNIFSHPSDQIRMVS